MSVVLDQAPADQLPSVSATQLVAGIQKVGRAVAAHGAVLITKHDQPAYVLMSVERYRELQRAAEPDLGALGGDGVSQMLEIMRKELDVSMALTGTKDIKDVGRQILVP